MIGPGIKGGGSAATAALPRPPRAARRTPSQPGARLGRAASFLLLAAAGKAASDVSQLRQQLDGHSVIEASSVKEAAVLLDDRRPDLVILELDSNWPDGLAMVRELKVDERLGAVPVVLVGTFRDIDYIWEGLRLGARDYLIKGETTSPLLARRMRGWLKGPQLTVKRGTERGRAEAVA